MVAIHHRQLSIIYFVKVSGPCDWVSNPLGVKRCSLLPCELTHASEPDLYLPMLATSASGLLNLYTFDEKTVVLIGEE